MITAMTLAQLAKECGWQCHGDAQFMRVCTDTRALQQGDLFIAIRGERFDGNDFIEQAASNGAAAIIANRKPASDIAHIVVQDTQRALGQIGRINRRRFTGPVVALTGSTGKTTCKEMVAAILSESGEVLATQGNFNNEIGVPLTLLRIDAEHNSAVIEMGAGRAGDIQYLCQYAEPTVGVVTNAMPAHLEGFGNIETIAKTKGAIFENLPANGTAIINCDDVFAEQWRRQAGVANIMMFGAKENGADVFADDIHITGDAGLEFTLRCALGEQPIRLSLLGRHNITNALAASAAAIAAGANLQQIKSGLAKVRAVSGRLQPLATPQGLVIDDSYNANPGAVRAAVDVMLECAVNVGGTARSTCLILGTMMEMGEQAQQLHEQVCVYAREQGVDQLIAVGEYAAEMLNSFAGKGTAFDNVDELLPHLSNYAVADVVLVKGSRSVHMEKVIHALMGSTGAVDNNLGEH